MKEFDNNVLTAVTHLVRKVPRFYREDAKAELLLKLVELRSRGIQRYFMALRNKRNDILRRLERERRGYFVLGVKTGRELEISLQSVLKAVTQIRIEFPDAPVESLVLVRLCGVSYRTIAKDFHWGRAKVSRIFGRFRHHVEWNERKRRASKESEQMFQMCTVPLLKKRLHTRAWQRNRRR